MFKPRTNTAADELPQRDMFAAPIERSTQHARRGRSVFDQAAACRPAPATTSGEGPGITPLASHRIAQRWAGRDLTAAKRPLVAALVAVAVALAAVAATHRGPAEAPAPARSPVTTVSPAGDTPPRPQLRPPIAARRASRRQPPPERTAPARTHRRPARRSPRPHRVTRPAPTRTPAVPLTLAPPPRAPTAQPRPPASSLPEFL